jgi:alkane 1-monooxygenase
MQNNTALSQLPYQDTKRYFWLFSVITPLIVGAAAPLFMLWTGDARSAWIPVLTVYIAIPLLDFLLGEDKNNPPESAVPALEIDQYYRYIVYATIPIIWISFIGIIGYIGTHDLAWYEQLPLILTAGGIGGFALNLGHELGHKNTKIERVLALLSLAPMGYGHFTIEHNIGHHRDVATPQDSASSRMGENIYTFMLREMPHGFLRAWTIESQRLTRNGQSVWSAQNEILRSTALTLTIWSCFVAWLGFGILLPMLAIAFYSAFQLTSANYIEHYGLLRDEVAPGKYETCKPHHSWNSNHIFSNWILFHLQRHSDHHANSTRRYQSLRHFENAPRLPSGYMGMYLVSYIPPLWFLLMDPRVVANAQGKARNINFQPNKKQSLIQKYHLTEAAPAVHP